MNQVKLDEALANKLQGLTEMVQLCDSAGRVLGWFSPQVDMAEWEAISPDVSEEELDRREQSNERRYTTDEVLDHLRNL
jgi:hypothetical protein